MKYLIQNTKEFVIAIAVIVGLIVLSILALKTGDYKAIGGAFVNDIFTLLGLYYNMPTSEENSLATGEMRQAKAAKKNGYVGENFTDEAEEVEEDV